MKKILLTIAACFTLAAGSFAQTVYFSENFESTSGSALPSGWTQSVAVGTPNDSVGWNTGTNSTLSSSGYAPPAHTRFVAVNDDQFPGANNGNSFLMTPSFSLAAATAPFLSFDCYYYAGSYGGITEGATVEVSTNGGTSWTVLGPLASNVSTGWETRYINLSAYAGQASVMIGFRYSDSTGWMYGEAVDNISVFDPMANDLGLTQINPNPNQPNNYAAAGSNVNFTGTVTNYGSNTVTSFNVT
jgi:hypothetical protein